MDLHPLGILVLDFYTKVLQLSVGDITKFCTVRVAEALILGTMMVGQAVAFAPNYSKARVAASQIFALLERRPAIDTSAGVGLRLVIGYSILLAFGMIYYMF